MEAFEDLLCFYHPRQGRGVLRTREEPLALLEQGDCFPKRHGEHSERREGGSEPPVVFTGGQLGAKSCRLSHEIRGGLPGPEPLQIGQQLLGLCPVEDHGCFQLFDEPALDRADTELVAGLYRPCRGGEGAFEVAFAAEQHGLRPGVAGTRLQLLGFLEGRTGLQQLARPCELTLMNSQARRLLPMPAIPVTETRWALRSRAEPWNGVSRASRYFPCHPE